MPDTSRHPEPEDPSQPSAGGFSAAGDETGMSEDDATVMGSSPMDEASDFPLGLTTAELAHLLRGEVLDHFHLLEYIGGGGMGVVFRAQDTTLNRTVAVKVVASRNVATEDLQRRFLVEAQSTARLDHPNIARVHYVGRDRGLPYIVFEYINGGNIRDLVAQRGAMPVDRAVGFALQVADALAHAWDRGVVHRDIKPSNIVVTEDGQAKLVDMGLARLAEVGTEELTNTGVTLGTFDYISPEQALDPRTADTRSDIYSLGCTLYFMLAGRPPFPEGTTAKKLLQHQGEPAPDLVEFRPDLPLSLRQLIARMLAKRPEERQQDPVELSTDLAAVARELGIEATPSALLGRSLPQPGPSWGRRWAPWLIPAAAIIAAAAAVAVYDAQVASDQPPPVIERPAPADGLPD